MTDRGRPANTADRDRPNEQPAHSGSIAGSLSVVWTDMGVHELLTEWMRWMQAGSMASRTVTERMQFITRFDESVRREGGAQRVGWQGIADYLRRDEFSTGTRATYYAQLQAWFSWLVMMKYREDDPTELMRAPKQPHRRPRPVTVEQVGELLRTPHHHRTTAMLLLAAYEGMRCHEVAKFRGEDISCSKVHIVGKGDRSRDVPLHDIVALIGQSMPRRGWWFPSYDENHDHVTAKSVSKSICDLMHRAGMSTTAHSLRHFYGTESLRSSGGNLELVRELMGHARLTTTAIYTQISDEDKTAAVAAMPVPLWVPPKRRQRPSSTRRDQLHRGAKTGTASSGAA